MKSRISTTSIYRLTYVYVRGPVTVFGNIYVTVLVIVFDKAYINAYVRVLVIIVFFDDFLQLHEFGKSQKKRSRYQIPIIPA